MFLRGWSPQGSVPNSVPSSSVGTPSHTDDKKSESITDEEMQEKIQFMVSLQTAAQEQSVSDNNNNNPTVDQQQTPPQQSPLQVVPHYVEGAHITPAAAAEAAAAARASGTNLRSSLSARMGLNILDSTTTSTDQPLPPPPPPPPPLPPLPPQGRSIMGATVLGKEYANNSNYGSAREHGTTTAAAAAAAGEQGVGQGHLYFPGGETEQHPMLDRPIPNYGVPGPTMVDHAVLDHDFIHDVDYVEPKQDHNTHCRLLRKCFKCCRNAHALHRSFCYGSIDGLLTGTGIVATFLGMKVLTARASLQVHLFVVAFSLAACTSDAICMALGHIWSTYVLSHASAGERRTERQSFESSRADAKAKLVDMLLSRGMLKIDAMSIADTLEGYPDIFVSALVGDSGYTLGEESLSPSASGDGQFEETTFSPLLRVRPQSYGQLNQYELDPEAVSVKAALGESRKEGFVMMVSFALFSVIPSVMFLWLSQVMNVSVKRRASGGTSVTSIAASLTSLIMLLLGIWKSRFFDSHWALFGMETVAVLWLCALSAYFIGFVLSMCIPGLRELFIEDNEL